MLISTNISTFDNFLELLGILAIFILILVAAYFTSKWIAVTSNGKRENFNIKVLETFKVTQNKFIQIIEIGDKCIAIAVCKDDIEFLCELDKNSLEIKENRGNANIEFKDILSKLTPKNKKEKE